MSSPENVPVGSVALEKEDWLQIIDDFLAIGPYLKASFTEVVKRHPEAIGMMPALDPETFEADVRAACAAMAYVAEFATDKCLFVPVEEE